MQRSIGTRIGLLVVAGLLTGCSVAATQSDPPASSTTRPVPSQTPATQAPRGTTAPTPAPTPVGPLGGGLLLVFQLDSGSVQTAEKQHIYTVDVGTGERHDIGTIPVSERTCCPLDVLWSKDRSRAFLFNDGYVAAVDVATGEVTLNDMGVERFRVRPSVAGDRIVWLNEFSGAEESLVLGDLDGTPTGTLDLPKTAWQTKFAWSPDDSALAITTIVTIPGLSFPQTPAPDLGASCCVPALGASAGILACCTPDHGVTAHHLMTVSTDGSGIRDLVSDEDLVRHDLQMPNPTLPPNFWTNGTLEPNRYLDFPTWAPDGGSIAYVQTTCEVSFDRDNRDGCTHELRIVQVADRSSRLVYASHRSFSRLAWSPAGDRIAFIADATERGEEWHEALFVVGAEGGEPTKLSDATGNVHWSPDGTWLSFTREGDWSLWAMPVIGGEPQLIAEHAAGGW